MTRLAESFTTTDLTFTSGGVPVRMTAFAPAGAEARPAVLVVHGASGLNASNRYVRQVAEAWAAEGFVTLLVHYFDRTKTEYASETLIFQEFETWLTTISDAVSFAATLPGVDSARLGLVGYSLGGYFVVASAARDARIRAAVEIAGGIDGETELLAGKLPPLLLVHGEADRRVPFRRRSTCRRCWRRTAGCSKPASTLVKGTSSLRRLPSMHSRLAPSFCKSSCEERRVYSAGLPSRNLILISLN